MGPLSMPGCPGGPGGVSTQSTSGINGPRELPTPACQVPEQAGTGSPDDRPQVLRKTDLRTKSEQTPGQRSGGRSLKTSENSPGGLSGESTEQSWKVSSSPTQAR